MFGVYMSVNRFRSRVNGDVNVTFRDATDTAIHSITLEQVGEALNITWIRQCRLEPEASSYRRPPSGWKVAVAQLARERARELERLAAELER